MARSKAISGGPVYLSDSPKEFVKENIFPLIDKEGKIFRPEAPAIPTPESVLTNPLQDGKAYRVFAPTGDEAVSVICYNLNTSPKHRKVTAEIDPKDYLLRETLTGKPTPQQKRVILFDWNNQTATELTGKQNWMALPTVYSISVRSMTDGRLSGYRKNICHLRPSGFYLRHRTN